MKALAQRAAWALALGLVGCGSEASEEDGTEDDVAEVKLELFSWWTAPGEAEALDELIKLHEQSFENVSIINAGAPSNTGGVDAKILLADRLKAGNPPDLFQQNAFEVLTALNNGTGKFEPLDDLFDAEGLREAIVPEVLQNVTHGEHVYAVPVNIHRENSLFYNMRVFQEHDITPPTTIDELLAVCAKLKAEGVTPFAVSPQSWILGKMFEGVAEGAMGPQAFVDYYTKGTIDEAKLQHAVEVYAQLVNEYSNVNEIDENFGWTQASDALAAGDVAMFLHGDWVKGYLVQAKGATPNVDFGVVGAPGAQDLFVYGVDVFVVPQGAPHKQAALDFLSTVASPEAQARFNTRKGSTPMRFDVPVSSLDAVAQEVLEDFKSAKQRVALQGSPALSDAIGWFTWMNEDHMDYYGDTGMLLRAAMENPPTSK